MLLHKIEPYEAEEDIVPVTRGGIVRHINKQTGKYEYTQWLNQASLSIRVGDYVIHRNNLYSQHKNAHMYYRVIQWQEVHMLLDYDYQGRPKAVELCDAVGNRMWVCNEEWAYVHKPPQREWEFDVLKP